MKKSEADFNKGNKGKFGTLVQTETQLEELISKDKEKNTEILNLKMQVDQVKIEMRKRIDQEADKRQREVMEAKAQLKKALNEKSGLQFDLEKLKAKQLIERDHFTSQKNDHAQLIAKLTKQKQKLA